MLRRDFRLPVSSLAMVAQKSFNGKYYVTILPWFYVNMLMLTLEVLSLFIHYLISIWTMLVKFELNCMVRTIQNFELFDKKWLAIFNKVLMPFWKMFVWLKQYSVCITMSLMLLLKQKSCLVVLHRGCLDKSGKWPHEMISLCHYMQLEWGHIQYLTQSEQIIRWRTNKPTPQN